MHFALLFEWFKLADEFYCAHVWFFSVLESNTAESSQQPVDDKLDPNHSSKSESNRNPVKCMAVLHFC